MFRLPTPSWKVRAILAAVALWWLGSAHAYWVSAPRLETNPALRVVQEIASIRAFAVVFLVLGVLAIGGVVWPSEIPTRCLMGISAVAATLYGSAILLSGETSPGAPQYVSFGAICLVLTGVRYRPVR